MAINQVQLPLLQQQFPDIAGQFIRGRQDKRLEDRQNRLLDIQEGNVTTQREQQAAAAKLAQSKEDRAAAAEQRSVAQEAERVAGVETERKKTLATAENTFWGRSAELLAGKEGDDLQRTYQQVLATAAANGVDITDAPDVIDAAFVAAMRNKAAINGFKSTTAKDEADIAKVKADTDKTVADTAALAGEKPKAKTEAQSKASGFHQRMIAAQAEIDRVLKESPKFEAQSAWQSGPAAISNMFASKDFQQYRQAADDWIRAKLRPESGATITDEEMDKEYSTYFPVFGDTDKVIKQKKRARKVAEKSMRKSAGGADPSEPASGVNQDAGGGADKGEIQIDANGNRARVYADGTFEEL